MKLLRESLLVCGVLASFLYVGVDVLAAIRYPEYHSFTARVISELMAAGAPTEHLVDPFFLFYGVLMMAFAVGVWMSGHERRVHVTGALLFGYGAIGLLGPTVGEMNVRGSGGDPTADVRHMALTGVLVSIIFASVGFGAALRGQGFRLYSFATMLCMLVFGILTGVTMRGVGTGEPTPWVGLMERIDIGAFLAWVAVLAVLLVRKGKEAGPLQFSARGMPPGAVP